MKVLYVTNLKDEDLSFSRIESLSGLRKAGLEEIVFIQTTPFDGWLDNLTSFDIAYKTLVEETLSLPAVLDVARREGVSLIVSDCKKVTRNSSRRSLINGLIKSSSVPVLVFNETSIRGGDLFEHLIFPTDWSPASERALTFLLGFSAIIQRLDIVNVINGKLTVKDMRELKERLTRTRMICLDSKIDAELHIYAGKTVEEIITASEDYKATLIALGAVPKKPFYKTMFRGNSSCRVAVEAEVPVLIVP